MNNTAIIILAAGSSTRFGNIKQLLHFNNKTLLQHVIDEAIESGAELVIVVTGANADEVSNNIKDEKIKNYQAVVPSTWNASPRDRAGAHGPFGKEAHSHSVQLWAATHRGVLAGAGALGAAALAAGAGAVLRRGR